MNWRPEKAGGSVYSNLQECLEDLQSSMSNGCDCTINGVTIFVYKHSCIEDICDKYDLTRRIHILSKG